MGCDVVVGGASPAEARAIERLFAERDRTFSRFRADSELSRVNRSSSAVVSVSAAFAEMVGVALQAAASSGGLVDPTLGEAIEAAGYDRDFGRLGPSPRPPRQGLSRPVARGARIGTRPEPADRHGVVKGKSVDDALELISRDGFVCAGGDLATRGALDVGAPRRRRGAPRRRRPRDERQREAALASRRQLAAPSDRPRNGCVCARGRESRRHRRVRVSQLGRRDRPRARR
jgi:thiamine biosynthesis lipoprotein